MLEVGQTFTRGRSFGYKNHTATATVLELMDECRDPWTGETGPGVRFSINDSALGLSYHTLLRPLFQAAWVH